MSNSTNPAPSSQNEEVDLGQLFTLIGNAFNRLFSFIGSIFIGLFTILINLLIVVRKNLVGFGIAVVIGASIGFVKQMYSPVVYQGTMVVAPNFESSRQLYNNISYYNTLVQQQDSIQLSKVLKISSRQASLLVTFEVEPVISESAKLQQYNNLIQSLDSTSRVEIDYEKFLNTLDPIDYKQHQITVGSKDRLLYPALRKPILASISENAYFKDKQTMTLKNIALNDSLTLVSLKETDSLRSVYEKVMIEEAKKQNASTSIVMEQQGQNNKELLLLDRKLRLQSQLESNNEQRLEGQEILKVISDFPEVGYVKSGILDNFVYLGALAGVLLFALWLVLRAFDAFLLKRIKD